MFASSNRPLGLTVDFFRHLVDLNGGRDAFLGMSTATVCKHFVMPYTATTQLSLVEHVRRHHPHGDKYVKPATWFVSHAWSYVFLDVVDALSDFMDDQSDDGVATAVWFCTFNNNQHDVDVQARPFQFWVDSFQTALTAIGNVVMVLSPWNNPTTLTRTWCVFEIYVATKANARFEVAMGTAQKAAFFKDIQDDQSFTTMLATIKSEKSGTFMPGDRANIVALMEQNGIGFADLDRMLFDVLDTWIIRRVETEIHKPHVALADKAKWHVVLGNVYHNKDAKPMLKQCLDDALRIYRDDLHDQDPATWKTLADAAAIYADSGDARAIWEPMYKEALTRLTQLFGPVHVDTLTTMLRFGISILNVGDTTGAMPLFQKCYKTSDRYLGCHDDLTLRAMNAIGMTLNYENQFATAETWLVGCYERRRHVLGNDHPHTLTSANNLGYNYTKQGKYIWAARLYLAVYECRRRTLGPENELTWLSYANLGLMFLLEGNFVKAKEVLVACADAAIQMHHTATRTAISNLSLGRLYLCTGELDKSEQHFDQALASLTKLHGPGRHNALNALYWSFLFRVYTYAFDTLESIATWEDQFKQANVFHDTWVGFSCVGCYRQIQGRNSTCTDCPMQAWRFCTLCVGEGKPTTFCNHGQAKLKALAPPARFLQERRLELLQTQASDVEEYETQWHAYQMYCATHQVPTEEQMHCAKYTIWSQGNMTFERHAKIVKGY
ncbi:Aste57867_12400 [Aphanomyces stellatus]|uniref:Aste57867_12400 protein n=1 Tax=Aphanomyces stellatus TaxID=120398 RepID=A0A485KWU3_9STRA|nr:hypothetical protein As57867_012354 [Aphanomyces stellatus]VFT89251.1 Aste57867_12400 [Aphanomyces stellatus]